MMITGEPTPADSLASRRKRPIHDVAVAYRIYPQVSKLAQILPFGDDKLQQAELCLRSFRDSLGPVRAKMWVILDGCPGQYRDLFQRYFDTDDLTFCELDSAGNRETFGKQLEILLSQDDSEFVYFAEDDYLYLPGQFPALLNFLRGRQDVDFVTPYDHPDSYSLALHRERAWITFSGGFHWRTGASTCLTFLTRRSTLKRCQQVLRSYVRGNYDCSIWLALTKRRIFDPLLLLRLLRGGEPHWGMLLKAWLFCWKQVLFGRKFALWSPIPGMATHYCGGLLSPGVHWFRLTESQPADHEEPRSVSERENIHGAKMSLGERSGPHVTIVLLNFNNWRYTVECLASLMELRYENRSVFVVDNGSSDDSVEQIRRMFPAVEILELGQNFGFAKGNNAGIRLALERGSEYIWVLNNDTIVDPDALTPMVERLDKDLGLGAVGSAIYEALQPDHLQAWGGGYVNFWLGRSRHFLAPVADEQIQFLTGASMLIRRRTLESIGLLDEGFFIYWEDADYCFRLRKAGWRLAVAGDSKIWHKETATIGKKSTRLDFIFNRSAKKFFAEHSPFPLFSILAGTGLRLAKRVVSGDWERVRAVWTGVHSIWSGVGVD